MSEIYTLDSDALLLDELAEGIRNREIEQKFVYQWKWAQLYYDLKQKSDIYDEYTINIKELWHLQNPKTFLCADFSTKAFRTELKQLTKFSKNRLFVFFSNTFWNIQHTNIIDILWNLLHKWEKIWLDVTVRQWTWIKEDFEMWQRMSDLFHNDETKSFFIKPITRLWIKPDDIELIIKTKKENFINALKFDFYYLIKNRSEINIKWEKIVILPNEEIKFLQIYTYDQYGLIDFFEEHDFKLVDKNLKGYRWQFLFEKK